MILNVAICDDNAIERNRIISYLHQFEFHVDVDFNISAFSSGTELLNTYTKPRTFDVLLLDIEMPNINGLDVAKKIRGLKDHKVSIIFISHYPEYMQQSMHVRPFFYLQKPIQYDDFSDILLELLKDLQESSSYVTLIKNDGNEEMLVLSDIYYIESTNSKQRRLCFHTSSQSIPTNGLISDWEQRLTSYNFLSCNRGLLFNLTHLHYIENNNLILTNGISLPVSRNKQKEIRQRYLNQIIQISEH